MQTRGKERKSHFCNMVKESQGGEIVNDTLGIAKPSQGGLFFSFELKLRCVGGILKKIAQEEIN